MRLTRVCIHRFGFYPVGVLLSFERLGHACHLVLGRLGGYNLSPRLGSLASIHSNSSLMS